MSGCAGGDGVPHGSGRVARRLSDVAGLPDRYRPNRVGRAALGWLAGRACAFMFGARLDGEPASQWFRKGERGWDIVDGPARGQKSPARSGPFKRAIGNRFVMIVGTAGAKRGNADPRR